MFIDRPVTFFRLLPIALSLWLLLVPASGVWGQDQGTPDGSESSEAVEVSDEPGEATTANEEEALLVDPAALPNRAFLPIQGGNQSGQAIADKAVATPIVQAANFDQIWVQEPCSGVAQGDGDLWDDIPSGTANNEASLIWLITNNIGDELCSHTPATGNLATGAGVTNQWRFRVAVNDAARFSVSSYRLVGGICSNIVWIKMNTTSSQDDNQFRTFSKPIPAGSTICSVQITLTDDPDNVAVPTSSALIDYIQLRDSVSGTAFWEEGF